MGATLALNEKNWKTLYVYYNTIVHHIVYSNKNLNLNNSLTIIPTSTFPFEAYLSDG